jgi:hypothetical protein
MPVDPTSSAQLLAAVSTAPTTRTLARAATDTGGVFQTALRTAVAGARQRAEAVAATEPPKGERSKAVEGRGYADILSGPRGNLFLNTSGNARDGEAFRLVKRNGVELHIYGTGEDRRVVALKARDQDTETTESTESTESTGPSATGGTSAPSTT